MIMAAYISTAITATATAFGTFMVSATGSIAVAASRAVMVTAGIWIVVFTTHTRSATGAMKIVGVHLLLGRVAVAIAA